MNRNKIQNIEWVDSRVCRIISMIWSGVLAITVFTIFYRTSLHIIFTHTGKRTKPVIVFVVPKSIERKISEISEYQKTILCALFWDAVRLLVVVWVSISGIFKHVLIMIAIFKHSYIFAAFISNYPVLIHLAANQWHFHCNIDGIKGKDLWKGEEIKQFKSLLKSLSLFIFIHVNS